MKPQTPEQVRADALTRIAVLKATRPPGWVKSARALCDKLADLADLDDGKPEVDQHDREEVAT